MLVPKFQSNGISLRCNQMRFRSFHFFSFYCDRFFFGNFGPKTLFIISCVYSATMPIPSRNAVYLSLNWMKTNENRKFKFNSWYKVSLVRTLYGRSFNIIRILCVWKQTESKEQELCSQTNVMKWVFHSEIIQPVFGQCTNCTYIYDVFYTNV